MKMIAIILKRLLVLYIMVSSLQIAQGQAAKDPVLTPSEYRRMVIEHLSGVKNHSGDFGLSEQSLSVNGTSFGVGPITASVNGVLGEFRYGGQTITINIPTVEVSFSTETITSGVSVNAASLFGGKEIDFITVRVSGHLSASTVFREVVTKFPVLAVLDNFQVLRAIEVLLDQISVSVGGTMRLDFLPITANNPRFAIRIAPTWDLALGFNGSGGREVKGSVGVGGARLEGRQFQMDIWHLEKLTGYTFPNAIRQYLDSNYGPHHPFWKSNDGSLTYAYQLGDPLPESTILGTGQAGTPLAFNSSFYEITGLTVFTGDLKTKNLAFVPIPKELIAGSSALAFNTEYTIGVAPPTGAKGGVLVRGGDPIRSNDSDAQFQPISSSIPILDNYQGVDFTNLKVVGLDVDQTTRAVNFIIKGTKTNGGGGNNLNVESKLLKTIFVEALSIPNNAQFVSLETNPPRAEAYEPFKHTLMGQTFFVADEKMKKDFANKVYIDRDGTNIVQAWYSRLSAVTSPNNFLRTLFDRGVIPKITFNIRANIIPVIPNGNKQDGKVYITDAKYSIRILDAYTSIVLENINGGNVGIGNNLPQGTVGITTREYDILVSELNKFNSFFVNKTNRAKNEIIADINNGVGGYKNLKRILPAVVAAHWYKRSNLADGSLKDLIDTGDLNSKYTGRSLYRPFNQSLWDSKASQLLGTVRAQAAGYQIESKITGGVTINNNVAPSRLEQNLESVQKVVFDESLTQGFNDRNFANAGGIEYQIAELIPSGIEVKPNAKNLVGCSGQLLENRPTKVFVGVSNNGNKEAKDVLVRLYVKKGSAEKRLIKSTTIASIRPYTSKVEEITFNPGRVDGNLLSQSLELTYTINENERIPELSYKNNNLTKELNLHYIILDHEIKEHVFGWELDASPNNYFSANEYVRLNQNTHLKSGSKLSVHATNRIVLEPGFQAKNGTKFRGWIGSDVEAIREYNRLNPVSTASSSKSNDSYNEEKDSSSEPLIFNKTPRLQLDYRLDSLRTRNLANSGFSQPNIANYEIIDDDSKITAHTPLFKALYPNPTNGEAEVEIFLSSDAEIKIELFNVNGAKIKTLKTFGLVEKGTSKYRYDLADVPSGVYAIIVSSKEKIESKLILKK